MEIKSNIEDDTKPYDIVERTSCPFYGFRLFYEIDAKNCEGKHIMEDAGGDQCAFASIINVPNRLYCLMESIKDKPNWTNCSLNTIENKVKLSKFLEKIRVFPREFRPAKVRSWRGISLEIWVRHITDMTN